MGWGGVGENWEGRQGEGRGAYSIGVKGVEGGG